MPDSPTKMVKIEPIEETLRFSDEDTTDEELGDDDDVIDADAPTNDRAISMEDVVGHADHVDVVDESLDIVVEANVDAVSANQSSKACGEKKESSAAEAVKGLMAEEERRNGEGKGSGEKEEEGKADEEEGEGGAQEEVANEEEVEEEVVSEGEMREEKGEEGGLVEDSQFDAEKMEQSQALMGLEEEEARRERLKEQDSPVFSQLDFDSDFEEVAVETSEVIAIENPKADIKANSKADSKAESKAESKAHSKAHSEAESKAHSKVHSEAHSKVHSEANSKVHSKAHSEANSEAHSEANSKADSKAESFKVPKVPHPDVLRKKAGVTKKQLKQMSKNASEIDGMEEEEALDFLDNSPTESFPDGSFPAYVADLDRERNTIEAVNVGVVGDSDDGGFRLALMPPTTSSDLVKISTSLRPDDSQVSSSSTVEVSTHPEQGKGKRVREESTKKDETNKKAKSWELTEVSGFTVETASSTMPGVEFDSSTHKQVIITPSTKTSSSSATKLSSSGSSSSKPSSSGSSSSKAPLFRPIMSSKLDLAPTEEPDFMDDIPMIGERKELTTILPNSSQLRDPMKFQGKENATPSTSSAAKKQTTLAKHLKHQFNDIPKVKKSTAVLGNYRTCVPSRLRHRCCAVCLRIFKNKLCQNSFDTPYAHIQNSHCSFIKANMTNQIGSTKTCHICFQLFDTHKHLNDDIIQHFADHDHPVRCPHCSLVVNFNSLFEHMVRETYELFKNGIHCARCRTAFYDVGPFYSHLKKTHDIHRPNWAHFNRYVHHNVKNRELAMFALLHHGLFV